MDAANHATVVSLEQTDAALQALGVVPDALSGLLERYLGGERVTAERADELLSALSHASEHSEPARQAQEDDFEVVVDDEADEDEPDIEFEMDVDDE